MPKVLSAAPAAFAAATSAAASTAASAADVILAPRSFAMS